MNWINHYAPKGLNERLPPLIGKVESQAEAARILGCGRAAVCRALKRLGLTITGTGSQVREGTGAGR